MLACFALFDLNEFTTIFSFSRWLTQRLQI